MKKYRKEVEEFFSEQLNPEDAESTSRWYIRYGKNGQHKSIEYDSICHAGMVYDADDIQVFASNFDVHSGHEEVAERYWNFLTGPNSPYRCLFENGPAEKILGKDGRQSGFLLNDVDVKDEKKRTLLYNFCIAMRMIHEEYQTIVDWSRLVDLGMNEVEALYLSRHLTIQGDTCIAFGSNDGSHWPFWFQSYPEDYWSSYSEKLPLQYIDFDKLKQGRPNFKGRSCDQWTTKGKRQLESFFPKSKVHIVVKGKFSKREGMLLTDVIKEFQEWVIQHQKELNT